MSLWRQVTRGLGVLLNGDAANRAIDDEVRHYYDELVADQIARGVPPDAAHRAARLEIGSSPAVRDRILASGWEHLVATLIGDVRYALRRLQAEPGFTIAAVVTLAVGIGATTAIFSAVNAILFEPLPYPRANEIVAIWDRGLDGGRSDVTFGTWKELVARARMFEAMAVMKPWQPTLTGGIEPERLDGQRVSASYFRVLGVQPTLGAAFLDTDDRVDGPNVVVLADGLWRRRFGGDPTIVGRQITLNDLRFTVAGIMPRDFENVLSPSAEIWAPLQYDHSLPPDGREWGHHLRLAARLRRTGDVAAARRELDAIANRPVWEFQRPRWAALSRGLIVDTLQGDLTAGVRPALLAVLGAVTLLLAMACLNVTNLVLARGGRRRVEMAMRAALGAGRARLAGQLLVESLVLAAAGGALGMAMARVGVEALVAVGRSELPRAAAIRVDGHVLFFAFVTTTVVGLLCGLIPALQASGDLQAHMQRASGRSTSNRRQARRSLVVGEVALALILLVSAGLLFRSLQRVFAVAPGFDSSHLLTLQVQASGRRFRNDDGALRRFFAEALEAARRVPGVADAAFTSQLPLSPDFEKYGVQFESRPNDDPSEDHSALRYAVTPGYFATMGIPLRRGRVLDDRDTAQQPLAAVINESFATRKFGGGDPIGQRVHVGGGNPWFTIVGVVGDVKHTSLAADLVDAVYTTTDQWRFADNPRSLVVRAHGDAAALTAAVRAAIWSVDKDQPIVRVATMADLVARSGAERGFTLMLFEAFAAVALVLTAVGIYGVLSGSVTERTREIGVRAALGASRRRIVSLIAGEGFVLAAIGGGVGLIGAFVASGMIASLLFGITRLDAPTYIGTVLLVGLVSAIACLLPAWRAARIDTAEVLRAE